MKFKFSYINILLLIICLNSLNSCGERSPNKAEDCKYGKPVSIFSNEFEQILEHNFVLKGLEGTENVVFENGIKLELIQSGCENLQQEFRFIIPETMTGEVPNIWVEYAIQLFYYMGNLDISLAQFSFWSQAFEELKEDLGNGTSLQLEPGRWVKVNGINSSDHSILIVLLSQQES